MNMKTAIIIGVMILLIPMIIAPFFVSKNNENKQNIVENLSGDKTEINEDISGENEDVIRIEIVTNENESGETRVENNIEESREDTVKEVVSQNDIEENNSMLNENVETTVKQAEIKQEQNVEVKVEQTVEVQASVQEGIETVVNDVVIPTESIEVLKIDKIGLFQPVMDGHSLEVLKTNLGHVDGSAYWVGNIGILGHNNGNAGFFKRLTELKVDDVIEYITEDGTRTYKVSEISEIEDTDWSKFASTKDNRITLVTCVKNVPTKRYCVQAIEI